MESRGTSPVIGVLIMLAVTVTLVSLTSVILFDVSATNPETPVTDTSITQINDTSVVVSIERNDNVDEYTISAANGQINGVANNEVTLNGDTASGTSITVINLSPSDEVLVSGQIGGNSQIIETYIVRKR